MRESENGEEGERRTPEGEGDGELLFATEIISVARGIARAWARERERYGDEEGEVLPPLLATEIPSRERER